MTRFVPVIVLLVLVTGGVRIAHAQTMGLPNNAQITFTELEIQNGTNYERPETSSEERRFFFNRAHCNCAKKRAGEQQNFRYLVKATAPTGLHNEVDFWVGSQCATLENRSNMSCKKLGDPTLSVSDFDERLVTDGGVRVAFNLFDVVNPTTPGNPCESVEGGISIYALAKGTAPAGEYSYSITQEVGLEGTATGMGRGVDTRPPPLPTELDAEPSDGGIVLSWDAPDGNGGDIAYYQALCADDDGAPARNASIKARYVPTKSVCMEADPEQAEIPSEVPNTPPDEVDPNNPEDPNAPDWQAAMPNGDFGNFREEYICGEAETSAVTSLRISGLENGKRYQVMLLAVDLHGNFRSAYLQWKVAPIPSTDFWEDLHNRGSEVEGGICLLAETYGDDSDLTQTLRSFRDDTLAGSPLGRWLTDAYYATVAKLGAGVHGSTAWRVVAAVVLAPLVAVALLWHWLTLPGLLGAIAALWLVRRHRTGVMRWLSMLRPARAAGLGAIALVAFGAGRAHADGYQPYWEETEYADPNQALDDPETPRWHVGVRIGPYTPDIDEQIGVEPGPYDQMFSGVQLLPMLDVDYFLWTKFGQAGIGGSIGYTRKSGRTYTVESMPTDPERARTADTNSFNMIPTAVTLTYRFTWFDDQYGVPVIPYVRGGLSYYLWWISTSSNGIAEACKPGQSGDGCETNRALGASLGYQGSLGVAIRAERIDRATAVSMRSSGIIHAGIYGEVSLAKVDGFGSDSKLSVGDTTYFGGINFEF